MQMVERRRKKKKKEVSAAAVCISETTLLRESGGGGRRGRGRPPTSRGARTPSRSAARPSEPMTCAALHVNPFSGSPPGEPAESHSAAGLKTKVCFYD